MYLAQSPLLSLLCAAAVGLVCGAAHAADFQTAIPAEAINAAAPPVPGEPDRGALSDWTVMYFINGKNNLESSAVMDMNQLELVGSTDRVKLVVEMGRMNGQPEGDDHSEGDWTGTRRYLVARDPDVNRIKSPVAQYLGSTDMGSWKALYNFIAWAKLRYPARRYALVMWDHGNGWKPVSPANAPYFNAKGFSLDDETGSEISTTQMAWALRDAGGVDFLMLDGCNMQMASVAYELKDHAAALTASEETEPGVVVRYAQFLTLLNKKPSMGPEEFAVNTVRTYRDYFLHMAGDPEGAPVTQSALRLSKLVPFRVKLDAWARAALSAEPEALEAARTGAKIFGEEPEYKDLYHFVALVTAATARPELKALGADVMRFMKSDLVIENWAQDEVSHGLAVYVPDTYDPLYDFLAWSRDGAWDDFARFMAKSSGASGSGKAAFPGGI